MLRQRWHLSRNHHFLGDVVQWFMRYPAGLQIENYEKVKIKPSFLKELDFAKANHMLPNGEVLVSWERSEKDILLEVSCPANIQCTLELEPGYHFIGRKEKCLECKEGITFVEIEKI